MKGLVSGERVDFFSFTYWDQRCSATYRACTCYELVNMFDSSAALHWLFYDDAGRLFGAG